MTERVKSCPDASGTATTRRFLIHWRGRMDTIRPAAGELCVCDLAAVVEAPETNVSHALRLLRTAGIVKARRAGRRMHYALDDAHVRLLLDVSREHLRHAADATGRA